MTLRNEEWVEISRNMPPEFLLIALSLPIVIHFDVLKDTESGSAPSRVPFPVNEFDFQRVEKALSHGIVITVGFAPHAAAQARPWD